MTGDGRPRILIAGGGVAAVETLLALRHLAGEQVAVGLPAPERAFVHRPSSVAAPFGFGAPAPLDLAELAQHLGAELYGDAVSLVDPEHRSVVAAPTHAFGLAETLEDGPHARSPAPAADRLRHRGLRFTAGEELSTPVRGAVEAARRELHERLGKSAAAGRQAPMAERPADVIFEPCKPSRLSATISERRARARRETRCAPVCSRVTPRPRSRSGWPAGTCTAIVVLRETVEAEGENGRRPLGIFTDRDVLRCAAMIDDRTAGTVASGGVLLDHSGDRLMRVTFDRRSRVSIQAAPKMAYLVPVMDDLRERVDQSTHACSRWRCRSRRRAIPNSCRSSKAVAADSDHRRARSRLNAGAAGCPFDVQSRAFHRAGLAGHP